MMMMKISQSVSQSVSLSVRPSVRLQSIICYGAPIRRSGAPQNKIS